MIVSKPVEETGFFWLPEDPEKRFPGFLRISESGAVTLEMTSLGHGFVGARSLGDPWMGGDLIEFKRIIGVTRIGIVTLEGCSERNTNAEFVSGLSTSIFSAKWAFIGVGYGKENDIVFSEFQFSLKGMNKWLGKSGIMVTHNEDKSVSINYSLPEPVVIKISDEFQMKFNFSSNVPTGFNIDEAKITQKTFVVFSSKSEKPLDDFLSLAHKIRNFFSFVTTRTAFIDSASGYSDEIKRHGGRKDYRVPVKIYFREFPYSDEYRNARSDEMLFVFLEIRERVEDVFRKWLRIYDSHESILNRYFLSNLDYTMDLERRFLLLVEGMAAIHKESYNPEEVYLVNRLKEMIEPFQRHFGSDDEVDCFAKKIVSARNYLAHLYRRNGDFVPDTDELFELNSKLEALFQLFLLRSVGIENEHIDRIVKENARLRGNLERKAGRT
ncbi:MAG: hypothetical protein OXM58_05655 [Rhodospirillaceae bacterium]|nr:hypothetical protein [Rhodospirillaceae bacterium]MDE0617539.1 hypothetical protein [Rhodospirillaceae bacterium]